MNQEKINQLNDIIEQAKTEKFRLLNEDKFKDESYIKSLGWTKDCSARLEMTGFTFYGLAAYKVYIFGKDIPHISFLNVMGEDKMYQNNIVFHNDFDGIPCFETSSANMLMQFLKTVKFQKIEYNETDLAILKCAEACSKF